MYTSVNWRFSIWLKILLIVLVLILPARCYNGYYLTMFEVASNISVQYINLVDFVILCITVLFFLGKKPIIIGGYFFKVCSFYVIVNITMLIVSFIMGYSDFSGELLSKSLIVFCAGLVSSQIRSFSNMQKSFIYLCTLFILIIASFFLSGYAGYASMNRAGSIGFGSNETASFACALLAVCLFVRELYLWIRIGGSALSFACILNVASRRGLVVAVAIVVIWLFWRFLNGKKKKVSLRFLLGSSLFIVFSCFFIYFKLDQIISYIANSPLIIRFQFAMNYNVEVMDYSDRLSIYNIVLEHIGNNMIFGTFGCDKLLAQNNMSHAHNILLQFIATYGIPIGCVFSVYYIVTVLRAFLVVKNYFSFNCSSFAAIISMFFLVCSIFDIFGYLLWNPKGLFWIVITLFLINTEYLDLKRSNVSP